MSNDHSGTFTLEELLAHQTWARRLAVGLVGEGAADDVLQETWIAAMRRPPRRGGPVRGWLATVLRNTAAQMRRGENRRDVRERVAAREEALPSSASLAERLDGQQRLASAVLELPELYRDTVALHYMEELSLAEIARREGVPSATVRGRLFRAHKLLKVALSEGGGDEPDEQRWLAVVTPLLLPSERDLAVTASSSVSVSVALAAVTTLAAGFAAVHFLSGPEPPRAQPEPAALERAAGSGDPRGEGRVGSPTAAPAAGARSPGSRPPGLASAPSQPSGAGGPARLAPPGPGWWLDLGELARVERLEVGIHEGRWSGRLHTLESVAGETYLDLAPVFTDPGFLPRELSVSVRGAHATAWFDLSITRGERLARHAGRAQVWSVPTDAAELARAPALRLEGSAELDGIASGYALLLSSRDGAAPALDVAEVAQDGSFTLLAPAPTEARREAWVVVLVGDEQGPLAPSWRRVDLTEQQGELVLQPQVGARVRGRLTCAGRAISGARLELERSGAGDGGTHPTLLAYGLMATREGFGRTGVVVSTGEDGAYLARGLEPGEHRLRLRGSSGQAGALEPLLVLDPAGRGRRRVLDLGHVVLPEVEHDLELELAARRVRVERGGRPVAEARHERATAAQTTESGELLVLFPERGLHLWMVGPYGARAHAALVPAARGLGEIVVLSLPGPALDAELDIQLTGAAAREVEAVTLEFFADTNDEPGRTPTAVRPVRRERCRVVAGRFTVPRVAPGAWRVRAVPALNGTAPGRRDGTYQEALLELELGPGERASLPLTFERGGRFQIPRDRFDSSHGDLELTLLGSDGEVVGVEFAELEATGVHANLPASTSVISVPALAPGQYLLVVRSAERELERIKLVLQSGETTVIGR